MQGDDRINSTHYDERFGTTVGRKERTIVLMTGEKSPRIGDRFGCHTNQKSDSDSASL